ncbi:hypothetical protein L195_g002512 [Trifolium pratense]|uniref:Uncharacterized protein n=1 Tax=Trifolium pratense TaxID=57577 RepID=A0A2K3NSN6_TRIPR|nr:hypothetical protein L195_g002512 [Trifolium pratense]
MSLGGRSLKLEGDDPELSGEYVESPRIPPKRAAGESDWRMACDIGTVKRRDEMDDDLESAAAAPEVVVERRRVVNCVERRVKDDAIALAMIDLKERTKGKMRVLRD